MGVDPSDGRKTSHGFTEMEKKLKFSHPDMKEASDKKESSGHHPQRSFGKSGRAKSSTLSLHALHGASAAMEEEELPPLQRRNSIHNVPFVDVHDPDTRSRMERYKEERRSMLRAKYKAEDYLSTTFTRKKKVSTTSSQSSQDSCDGDNSSVTVTSKK